MVILSFWFLVGGLVSLLQKDSLRQSYFAKKNHPFLKGWISSEPQLKKGILKLEMTVTSGLKNKSSESVTGKLLISIKVDTISPIQINYGDQIIVPRNFQPIEESYNPGEFDFKAWLSTKNIFHQCFLRQGQLVNLNNSTGNALIAYAIELRKRQVAIYRKLIHNEEAFAVASTLVLGYRSDLDKETLSAYSETGTIHALSVSGMHVGIIYIFLNWALFFMNRNSLLKIIKLVLICSLIWYYSLLTGLSPSVLRSAVMLTVYILAKAFSKNTNSYNILCFTAFSLLFYQPFLIWDVGFQLSFLAVFGLIYLQPKIYSWFNFDYKWLDKLWSIIALSLAAQLATFPLSIYYFHQFPVYFIISNLFILLPLTAIMYLGIAVLVLHLFVISPVFEWLIIFTNAGLKWIADLPFSVVRDIWINSAQLILLSFSLIILCIAVNRHHKKLFFYAILSFLGYQGYYDYRISHHLKQTKVIFFSLRKNYAAAFISGRQAIIVTDLTRINNNFNFYVKPALMQLQVNKISFIDFKKDTINQFLVKTHHQLAFYNYRLLLLDQNLDSAKITLLPKFDAVWVNGNPKRMLCDLAKEVVCSSLILDATNGSHLIRQYETEANKIGLRTYTLKKNKAYLIDLN